MKLAADFHGVSVFIMTNDTEGFRYIPASCKRQIEGERWLVFEREPDTKAIVQAAGHDWGSIDYAYPIDWARANTTLLDKHGGAVWSYEDGSIMGHPVFFSELWAKILARASMYVL